MSASPHSKLPQFALPQISFTIVFFLSASLLFTVSSFIRLHWSNCLLKAKMMMDRKVNSIVWRLFQNFGKRFVIHRIHLKASSFCIHVICIGLTRSNFNNRADTFHTHWERIPFNDSMLMLLFLISCQDIFNIFSIVLFIYSTTLHLHCMLEAPSRNIYWQKIRLLWANQWHWICCLI